MSLQYTPLDPEKAQIRVLKLPGSPPSTIYTSDVPQPLTCSVDIISLDDNPSFIALSYVWGTVASADPITVDGLGVQVTQNLYDAISWYLAWRPEVPIWADAVCINQDDLEEKNKQVRLMSRIYKEATNTICWLGLSTPRIDQYLEIRHRLPNLGGKLFWLSPIWKWLSLCCEIWYTERSEHLVMPTILKALNGQVELGELPYFQRIWTFQEMILPGKKAIFVIGGQITENDLTRPHFVLLPDILHARAWKIILGAMSTAADIDHASARLIWEELHAQKSSELISDFYKLMLRLAAYGHYPVANLLVGTAQRASHDPRDKVFGIAGLLCHGRYNKSKKTDKRNKYLSVDYTKAVEAIALDALYYTYSHESPAMLPHILAQYETCFVTAFRARLLRPQGTTPPSSARGSSSREWPSWLPDLSHSRYGFGTRLVLDLLSKPYLDWHRLNIGLNKYNILDFNGKLVGHIQTVFTFSKSTIEIMSSVRALRENAEFLEQPSKDDRQCEILAPKEIGKRADIERICQQFLLQIKARKGLWRRVSNAMNMFRRPMYRELWGMEEVNLYEDTRWTGTSPSAEEIRAYQEEKADSLRGQALFILDTGRFGFCAANVRVGDLAVMSHAWGKSRGWLLMRHDTVAEEQLRDRMNEGVAIDMRGEFYQLINRPYVDGMRAADDPEYLREIQRGKDKRLFLV